MKIIVLIVALKISFVFFSQDSLKHEAISGINLGFNVSKPFVLNPEAKEFFKNQMGLNDFNSFGYGLNFELSNSELYVSSGMEYSNHNFQSDTNSIQASVDLFNSFIGIGYRLQVIDNFNFGLEVHGSVIVSFQSLSKVTVAEDLYLGQQESKYNILTLENKHGFNFGFSPFARIQVLPNLSISLRYTQYLFNLSKLGKINNIQLYRKYSNVSIGVVLHNFLNTSSKRRKKNGS